MKKNLLLLFGSIFFCILLLVVGESFCRIFLDINYVGISKNSFTPKAFGESHGNAKNVEAEAFGVKVYTDEFGFRIDPSKPDKKKYDSAIVLMGDSVSFGVGVEADKTLAGLLRKKSPDVKIYNTSVSGYRVNDYKNVVTEFITKQSEVKEVYLFFCLNDISYTPIISDDEIQVDDARLKGGSPLFKFLAKVNNAFKINMHLRQRSHLYHLIKNIIADPSEGYFLYDLQYYSKENLLIEDDMKVMLEMKNLLESKGIGFKVLILPYKVQLNGKDPRYMAPQKILSQYFKQYGIEYIDTIVEFNKKCTPPSQCFLFGDPLHLSAHGHKIIFEIMSSLVEENRETG